MADKRIIEQNASTTVPDDAFFIFDSALLGTFKISRSALLDFFGNATITEVTKAQYDALPDTKLTDGVLYAIKDQETSYVVDIQVDGDSILDEDGIAELATVATSGEAEDVSYDNSESGLTATNVQDAIDEVLEEGGKVQDVKVDGESVVDENKVAQITTPDADGISYDNTTSGLEADDVQEAIDEVVTDIESVETALETKADVDGFYDELYAGNLLSDNTETDNAPYTYRPSPSGKSCVDLSVVGGTVAWNQLYNIPASASDGGINMGFADGVMSFSGESIASYFSLWTSKIQSNHKILVSANVISNPNNLSFSFGSLNGQGNVRVTGTGIFTNVTNSATISYNTYIGLESYGGAGKNFDGLKFNAYAIDLTQMFGSTIADYIYSLEQSTAGSGIAWLKSYGFLTKDYYAYQSGKLESVNVASRKVYDSNDTLVATYPLDSDLTLRGIPKIDANNNLYYDGDIYASDGSVTRRYGIVDLGSLSWTYYNQNDIRYFYAILPTLKQMDTRTMGLMCVKYPCVSDGRAFEDLPDKSIYNTKTSTVNAQRISVVDNSYSDAQALKTALNGVYLVYELATPTTESATPYTNPQLVGSTEEFVDAGTSASTPTRDVDIPVGQDSKYHTDLKAKLEELAKIPDVPSTNGTYTLKATRSASGVTYSWVSG